MNIVFEDLTLPSIREDLQLLQGPVAFDGSPTWNIFDPIRNRYFRIGWIAFELLSRWSSENVLTLLKKIKEETVCQVTKEDVKEFITFLYSNGLTIAPASGYSRDYYEQHLNSSKNWLSWIIQNYLFIRIPLVKPDRFLRSTLFLLEPLFSRTFFYSVIALGVIGLYLVTRQWDTFANSFLYFFNLNGFLLYFVALFFLKIFHELGHAYTATRYGCKISTIGIAFLVMFPVLYTDTSDAWKLNSQKKKLYIGFAGMMTELYIACIATFIWAFLPDGITRSIVFILATSSWIISLTINLNPFMRFDGYYLLSDFWNIENLQHRAFRLGKWRLRELLFALGLPKPENIEQKTEKKLVWYAWATWLYRFFLFLGIALLVYHFFFKLLGIILFIVEIVWFILLPIFKELNVWWDMRQDIVVSKRFYSVVFISLFLIGMLFIPWNSTIRIPAILESTENIQVYTPVRSQIVEIMVEEGDNVTQAQTIMRLDSPILTEELNRVNKQFQATETKINRLAANREDLANIHVHLSHLEELTSKRNGLLEKNKQLNIVSPINGKVIDISDNVHSGRWINQTTPLMNIIDDTSNHVIAFLEETDISRVSRNQSGEFYPENPQYETIAVEVADIEQSNVKNLENYYFHHQYGGDIATRQNDDGQYVPENTIYKVLLTPVDNSLDSTFVIRGTVHIEGESQSLANRISNLVLTVLIRETGF